MVIPDIHANLDRFKKILRHRRPTDNTVTLGDFVHKGPRPIETLYHLKAHYNPRSWKLLWGNHDLLFVLSALGSRRAQIKQIELGEATTLLIECKNYQLAHEVQTVALQLKKASKGERNAILHHHRKTIKAYGEELSKNNDVQTLVAWICNHFQLLHHSRSGILYVHAGIPVKNKKPLYSIAKLYQFELKLQEALRRKDFNAPIFRLLDSNVQSPLRVRRWLEKIKKTKAFCKRLGVKGLVVGHSSIWSDNLEALSFPIIRHDIREKGSDQSLPSYLLIQQGSCISHYYEDARWHQTHRGTLQ